jgi:predicted small secreted protein
MKIIHIVTLLLVLSLTAACANTRQAVISDAGNDEILYVLPDGTMEFKGRVIADEEVVIYQDGRGGERAAVKLYLPLYSHAWRDTIEVERVMFDVPIASRELEEEVSYQ